MEDLRQRKLLGCRYCSSRRARSRSGLRHRSLRRLRRCLHHEFQVKRRSSRQCAQRAQQVALLDDSPCLLAQGVAVGVAGLRLVRLRLQRFPCLLRQRFLARRQRLILRLLCPQRLLGLFSQGLLLLGGTHSGTRKQNTHHLCQLRGVMTRPQLLFAGSNSHPHVSPHLSH